MPEREAMTMELQWSCSNCGYVVKEERSPEECPSCHQKCEFRDVSCYVPECGGPTSGNVDPRLVGKKD